MPSSMPAASKPRPYRRFLTSALHSRFVHAASIALIWHWIVAGLAGDWYTSISSFFWAFNPISTAGIKALLFSLTSFSIFMLQIATFRIGKRCTPSNWSSIRNMLSSYSTYATVFWYVASAWWFCEVFVFTSPTSKQLGWIINGGYGSPDKLNERPIYLRMFFLLLGVIQSALHLYYDSSALSLSVKDTSKPRDTQVEKAADKSIPAWLLAKALNPCIHAAMASCLATLIGPFLYNAVFRSTFWTWHIWWAKVFANIARSEAMPPKGVYLGGIMPGGFFFGFLLSLTWQVNIVLFETYMLQEPTRNGKPLSTSGRDPNGTLLQGLSAKIELVKTFAFWELDIIAHKHADRRRNIFGDFERPVQGPIFTSMVTSALGVLNAIESRITILDPPPNGPAVPSTALGSENIQSLPRILPNAVPARSSIFLPNNPTALDSRIDRVGNYISHEVKTLGNSQTPWSPPLDRTKQLAIEYYSPTIKEFQARAEAAQQSPLGRYLLTSPIRLIKSAILGSPTGNAALTLYAASSITRMLVVSLSEDSFGKAVQCVPSAVQTLTKTIFTIEDFVNKHTNGGFVAQSDAKDLSDVVLVHKQLKSDLRELLAAFQLFLNDVGLSIRNLNEARKAAEGRELFQVIRPADDTKASRHDHHDRSKVENTTSEGGRKEMEEVNTNRGQQEQRQQQEEVQVRRRRSQKDSQEKDTNNDRRGRLFPQLDEGSAYQQVLKERRKSVSKEQNPLTSGSVKPRKQTGSNDMSENPFGAKDFNTLPAGGVQRRRVGAAR